MTSPARILEFTALGGFAANAVFALHVVWNRLNVLQIDAAGHIASAHAFRQGFFHKFYDVFFQGWIQNLFYPPLEDALIAGLSFFTGEDMVLAYKLYLSLLIPAWLFAVARFSGIFETSSARAFYLFAALFLVNLDKPGLTHLQGLSMIDIFVAGLAAQVLGATFYFLLLRQLVEGRRGVVPLLLLTILSHLVIGPIAGLTVLAFGFIRRSRRLLVDAALAVLLCTFFLGPALAYRGSLFSSTIFHEPPAYFGVFLVLATLLLIDDRRHLGLPLTGLLLILPQEIQPLAEKLHVTVFPAYHYYRLTMPAIFLLVISVALLLEKKTAEQTLRPVVYTVAVLLLFFLARDNRIHHFDPRSEAYSDAQLPAAPRPADASFERIFVINAERPSDFYLGSLFAAQGTGLRFSKGLFWESSRDNTVLSSYLATMLAPSSIVLDYWSNDNAPCAQRRCFLDHFLRDGNVGAILAVDPKRISYLKADEKTCWEEILGGGTAHFRFRRESGSWIVNGRHYRLYDVEPRSHEVSNAAVDLVDPSAIQAVDAADPEYFSGPMRDTRAACEAGRRNDRVYVHAATETPAVRALRSLPAPGKAAVRFEKTAPSTYEIHVDEERDVLMRIKLAYFPGFELRGEDGHEIELHPGVRSMLAAGHGRMVLTYRRTTVMKVCYSVSVLTLAAAFVLWTRRRWDS